MKTIPTTGPARLRRWMALAVLLAIAAPGGLRAQFQTAFGGLSYEAAQGGIIQTFDGNFVAVGYSYSFTPDEDVYVVKSDPCGRVVWAKTYDLGGQDVGHKIRQLADGSLIIVGSTFKTFECVGANDAFLLEIDADGNVLWASTYGGLRDDEGLDVITESSDIVLPTFTVAGRSNSYSAAGDYDAWLFRTDATGNILWGRVYGMSNADGFTSLDIDCDGSIVAAGASRSYSRGGDEDIFVLWAGTAAGSPVHAAIYGRGGDEGARSIVRSGDALYLAGYTSSFGSGTEGYVMRGRCASGLVVNDHIYGGRGTTGNDQFTELHVLPTGNLILTGFMENNPRGFGKTDVWMTELGPALTLAWSDLYGGYNSDQGWSVAVVDPGDRHYRLIQAGLTTSFGSGRVNLYEILTNSIGGDGCNTTEPELQDATPGLVAREVDVPNARAFAQRDVPVTVARNDQYLILCNSCDGEEPGDESLSGNLDQRRVPVVVRSVAAR